MLSRVLFEKIYLYFNIEDGQPFREPALCQLYRYTFVPCTTHGAGGNMCSGCPSVRAYVGSWGKHSLTGLPSTSSFSCLIGRPLQPVTKLLWRTFVSRNHILFFFHKRQSKLRLRSGAPLMDQFKYTQRCQICAALC